MKAYQTKEEKKAFRERKKEYKKRIIAKHGFIYYLRDKTWFNIKDQRSDENYEAWKHRLASYGFTTDGEDIRTGDKHCAEPIVFVASDQVAPVVEEPTEIAVAEEATEEAVEAPMEDEPAEEAVGVADNAVEVEVAEEDPTKALIDEIVGELTSDPTEEVKEETEKTAE